MSEKKPGTRRTPKPFKFRGRWRGQVTPKNDSRHRAELSDFASRVAGDFVFHVRRYQDVYKRLAANAGPQDGPYMEYLAGRYFRDTQTGLLPGDCRPPSAHGQAKT